MKSKSLLKIILIALGLYITPVYASTIQHEEAVNWVNATGHKLINALSSDFIQDKYDILDEMFEEDVNTEYMARFVIGKYWNSMDEEQQETYLNLFNRYAVSLYKNYPLNFNVKGLDFEVISVKQVNKLTDVSCLIDLPDEYKTEAMQNINVKFRLNKDNGKIKIVDLIFAESSLLMAYRSRFYTMIHQLNEEMGWFLDDFYDLVKSSEANAEKKANN